MASIDIYLRSDIEEDSFDAVEIQARISRIKVYVPSTDYARTYEIRGNWSNEQFQLTVPDRYLNSTFPLRFQAQFPGGSKLAVEAKVFEPTRVDLVLKDRSYIEGKVAHTMFANRSVGAGAVGCELSCPGTKEKMTGSDTCIECSNSRGARFRLCC
jgi:hypothetical protein